MLSAIGLEYDDGSSMDFSVDREGISMKPFECVFLPKTDRRTYRFQPLPTARLKKCHKAKFYFFMNLPVTGFWNARCFCGCLLFAP